MKNYYRILGILDDAEDIVIRAAYKALAQRYHPDKWVGDANVANIKMSEINEAYAVLSDEKKRKDYDSEYFRKKNFSDKQDDTYLKKSYPSDGSGGEYKEKPRSNRYINDFAKKYRLNISVFIILLISLILYENLNLNRFSVNVNKKIIRAYDFYSRENPKNCQSEFQKNRRMSAEFSYNKETNKIFMRMDFHNTNEKNLIFELEQCEFVANLDNWSCGGVESDSGISPLWKMTDGVFTYNAGYKKGSPILCEEKIVERTIN